MWESNFKACNLEVGEKICLTNSNKIAEQEKYFKKLFIQLSKLFINHIDRELCLRNLLKSLYCIVNLLYWVEFFETEAWNILLKPPWCRFENLLISLFSHEHDIPKISHYNSFIFWDMWNVFLQTIRSNRMC